MTVRVEEAPIPLSPEDQAKRDLLRALWRFLKGEPAEARRELDTFLVRHPRSPGTLALRACFLDGEWEGDRALAAYGKPIQAHEEARPDAPEPPSLLIERRHQLLVERLKREEPPREVLHGADPNADGVCDLSDAVSIFSFLFLGGEVAGGCHESADADDTGPVDITHGIYLLGFLFLNGKAIPAPFGQCGADPNPDALTCQVFAPGTR